MSGQPQVSPQNGSQQKTNNYVVPLTIIGVLFFALGFITWLDSTLINFLKIACQIDNTVVLFFITAASYISFFVMSIPASWVLKATGYKKGMSIGLLVMAVGALIFIPAAETRTYGLFLVGIFVMGTGMSLIQTAINPYVTILGPLESAAKRISMMGIANKVAGAIGTFILSAAILAGANAIETKLAEATDTASKEVLLNDLSHKIIGPFVIIAVACVVVAIWVWLSGLPEVKQEEKSEDTEETPLSKQRTSVLQFPHLILGVIALFLYVGCEVLAGDTIGQYGRFLGFNIGQYKYFTTYALGFMVIGYILGIILTPKYVSQRTALWFCSLLALFFSICAILTSGWVTILFITLLGFANSIMWPAIWPLSLNKLGHFTKTGSALLVMSIAGGGVLPLIWGAIVNVAPNHPEYAYLILLPSYGFILFFALHGYKVGLHSSKQKFSPEFANQKMNKE